MPPPIDPLETLFERWEQTTPHIGDSLNREVWRRIANSETRPTPNSWFSKFESAFARPAFAAAFVASCMLLGLFLAEVRLSKLHEQRSALVESSYLRLLTPPADVSANPTGMEVQR